MKKYIAEFIGTFLLVFIGCGAAAFSGGDIVVTPIAFGLTLMIIVYTIGNVSGAHVNPAVSFGMFLTKRMSVKEFLLYMLVQFIGAIAAAALLGVILQDFSSLGGNTYGGEEQLATTVWIALAVEVILTFIFVSVVLNVTAKKENAAIAGLVIGLTLLLVHVFGIPFTGTSVNPARSFGPAIFEGGDALKQYWLFYLAPLVGAALSALFYKYIMEEKTTKKVKK